MRLHDRYLFRELLTPLAYCLGGFLIFWLSYFFFTQLGEMQERQFNLLDAGEFALAQLPEFLVMVLPIALLLALLYALTHHARHHEITALRAAGISLWRLCAPYFVVGLVTSGIYFALNEIAVPQAAAWSEQIKSRHVKTTGVPVAINSSKGGFRNARAHRLWQISEFDATTGTMVNPNVTWTLPDGSWRALRAERGVRTNGIWIFYNAQLFAQASANSRLLPIAGTNLLAMPEFDETPQRILRGLKFSDTQSLRGSRSADIPLADLWAYLRDNPDLSVVDAQVLLTKFYGRLAAPWTCLVVVLIAIPFGAPSGRRNLFYGVAGSIFIAFTFFVLQKVCPALGMTGFLPAWLAAWLPNLIFAAAGIVLTQRTR